MVRIVSVLFSLTFTLRAPSCLQFFLRIIPPHYEWRMALERYTNGIIYAALPSDPKVTEMAMFSSIKTGPRCIRQSATSVLLLRSSLCRSTCLIDLDVCKAWLHWEIGPVRCPIVFKLLFQCIMISHDPQGGSAPRGDGGQRP